MKVADKKYSNVASVIVYENAALIEYPGGLASVAVDGIKLNAAIEAAETETRLLNHPTQVKFKFKDLVSCQIEPIDKGGKSHTFLVCNGPTEKAAYEVENQRLKDDLKTLIELDRKITQEGPVGNHIKTGHWDCIVQPDTIREEKVVCTHELGGQQTMTLELPWWGAEVSKIPYSKGYDLSSIGAEDVREPADLDIQVLEPKSVREDYATKSAFTDPAVGAKMDGKRRVLIAGDNIVIGVETGSSLP